MDQTALNTAFLAVSPEGPLAWLMDLGDQEVLDGSNSSWHSGLKWCLWLSDWLARCGSQACLRRPSHSV